MTDLIAVLTAELAANPAGDCTLVIGATTDTIPTALLAAAFGVHSLPVPTPTPAPIVPPATTVLYQAKVNSSAVGGLNVRASGSITAKVLGQLHTGDIVDVYSDTVIVTASHTWQHIETVKLNGWVAQEFIDKIVPGQVIPPVQPTPKHKIGLHVFPDGVAAAETFINAAHPPSVTVIDDPAFANKAINLGVPYVIYRSVMVANGDNVQIPQNDPALSFAYGRQVVSDRWSRFAALDKRVFIQITNEQAWTPGHDSFWLGVMTELESRGYHAAIGAYSVGTPLPEQWIQLTGALTHAKSNGHIAVLHAYCAPGTSPGQLSAANLQQYYEERFPVLYAAVPTSAQPPLVISEYEGEFSRGKFQGEANLLHLVGLYEAANAQYGYLKCFNLWTAGTGGGSWSDACIDSALSALAVQLTA